MTKASRREKRQKPSLVFDICSWLLYGPICNTVRMAGGNPSVAKRTADLLGEVEFVAFRKSNRAFEDYLAGLFKDTPLSGRQRELAKKCLKYRYRRSLGMLIEKPGTTGGPIVNREYLALANARSICFPVVHFGYHYSAGYALGTNIPMPVYAATILEEKSGSRIRDKNNKIKMRAIASQGGFIPIQNRDQLLSEVLPAVAAGKASYFAIVDAFSNYSRLYPFLGGQIMLSIAPIAKFAIKNNIPILPFFCTGEEVDSRRVIVEKPLDPSDGADTIEAIEQRYIAIFEQYALQNPEVVDWFLFWKRVQLFRENYH